MSAVLFLAVRTGVPWYTLIALAPLLLFFLLDVYYLSLERRFRGRYNHLLEMLHDGTYDAQQIYRIVPEDFSFGILSKCLLSPSVYLYYPPALCITVIAFAAQFFWGTESDTLGFSVHLIKLL